MNLGFIFIILFFPLLLLATSFTRVFIVLTFIKKGLGEVGLPSGQIVFALALLFSLLIMKEPLGVVYSNSIQPMIDGKKTPSQAIKEMEIPLRSFMSVQVSQEDLLFVGRYADPQSQQSVDKEIPFLSLLGAFALSELKKGLFLGFLIWIPFLLIDLFASVFVSNVGIGNLNAAMLALPIKIILFIALDGWKLLFGTIAESYLVR
jgi:flagellar biosynthetic protein FliP